MLILGGVVTPRVNENAWPWVLRAGDEYIVQFLIAPSCLVPHIAGYSV